MAERVARRFVAADQHQDQIADEIAERHRRAVDLGIGEQRGDVAGRFGAARLEQLLAEGEEFAQRRTHRFRALAEFGIVLADEGVGPVVQLGPQVDRHAEQLGQRHQRQRCGEGRHQIDRLAERDVRDQLRHTRPDARFDVAEPGGDSAGMTNLR